jgi:tRNA G18 (ribose-2'-O)-methylase SpoU
MSINYKYINTFDNSELNIYKTLRDKSLKEERSFIADSPKVVNVLLYREDIEVKSILATQEYFDEFEALLKSKNIPICYVADKELMQEIVGHKIHHNCMMHGVRPKDALLENLGDHIIMLDAITSTENIGSIARSAAALGVDSYLIPNNAPHPYSRRSLRVSMGYISKLKYTIYEDIMFTIKRLQESGYRVFAAELSEDSIKLQDVEVPQKWVVLMGHEGRGLSQNIIDACDASVEIEMYSDVKSLNVGVAASLMMYHFKSKST